MPAKHGHIRYLTVIGTIALFATTSGAEEKNTVKNSNKAELKYVTTLENDTFVNQARRWQDTTPVKPQELLDVPADILKEPAYFTIHIGNKDVYGITYRSTDRLRQVKLCLDTDGDNLLSDEKQYICTGLHNRGYKFGPVLTQHENTTNIAGAFYAEYYPDMRLTYYPVLYRQGQIVLDSKTYKIALIDCDYDGKYNKSTIVTLKDYWKPESDILAIDLNGDSKFNSDSMEIIPLHNIVKVNKDYYRIQVAEDGSVIEFVKVNPQYGTLDVGSHEASLSLWSDTAYQKLSNHTGRWDIPAGKYGLISLELTKKDSEGKLWTIRNKTEGLKKYSNFEIRPGQTTSFQIGGPFHIKTTMKRSDNNIMIDFYLEGKNEVLYAPCVWMNKENVPEPEFKIIDDSEQIVHSGRFKHG